MSKEVKDGHPCDTCLRWPECNGVAWPDCRPGLSIADFDPPAIYLETTKLVKMVADGTMTPNEARRRMGLREI